VRQGSKKKFQEELSSEEALSWYTEHEFVNSPPYFLSHWKSGKRFLLLNGVLAAFEKTKSHFVLSGDPLVSKNASLEDFYNCLAKLVKEHRLKLCGYSLSRSEAVGEFKFRKLGTSSSITLDEFDIESPRAREVRRSLRKGSVNGYKILNKSSVGDAHAHQKKLSDLVKRWKKAKLPIKINYLLSDPRSLSKVEDFEDWYVIEKKGSYWAYCCLLPYVKNGKKSYYIDHLIYDPRNESHALSFLVSSIVLKLKAEKISELNLGLNPFASIDGSDVISKILRALYSMPVLYRPRGIHYFKRKFSGNESNEYLFCEKQKSEFHALADMAMLAL
jgi:lysylphosphatidylglycerol synthetase-like protein (DUF2156 family)